jgi:hypothetical protein
MRRDARPRWRWRLPRGASRPWGLVLSSRRSRDRRRAGLRAGLPRRLRPGRGGLIMTLGVRRLFLDGYGYISPASPIPDERGAFVVARFVVKPDAARARVYRRGLLWKQRSFLYVQRDDAQRGNAQPNDSRAARARCGGAARARPRARPGAQALDRTTPSSWSGGNGRTGRVLSPPVISFSGRHRHLGIRSLWEARTRMGLCDEGMPAWPCRGAVLAQHAHTASSHCDGPLHVRLDDVCRRNCRRRTRLLVTSARAQAR